MRDLKVSLRKASSKQSTELSIELADRVFG
jgi:hypothetical protein